LKWPLIIKGKKKGKDGVGLNKTLAQERTPYHIVQRKGKTKANVGLPIKKLLMVPKKNKGKEKVYEPSKELSMDVDLHSSKKTTNEVDYLLNLLNEPIKGKGAKQVPKHPNVGKSDAPPSSWLDLRWV
jgi:hypothetical protein